MTPVYVASALMLVTSAARADWPRVHVWGDPPSGGITVRSADVDLDGDRDIVSASQSSDLVFWYENLGAGTFGPLTMIDEVVDPAVVRFADLDLDGDEDLLLGLGGSAYGANDEVWRYDNLGGSFSPPVLLGTLSGDLAIEPGDVDADGDIDVLVADPLGLGVGWYPNVAGLLGPFVAIDAYAATAVALADLNGDGIDDVVAGAAPQWYPGLGAGGFAPSELITIGWMYEASIATGDLDGDGDVDVAFADQYGGGVKYNDGLGNFGSLYSYTGVGGRGPIQAVDLDQDGVLDLLTGGSLVEFVEWHPSGGGELPVNAVVAADVWADDITGDGLPDVLSTNPTFGVSWTQNTGLGGWATTRAVSMSANSAVVIGADLDGDGDSDAVTGTDGISWFANEGGQLGSSQSVASDGSLPTQLDTADFDGDGVLDVLASSIWPSIVPGTSWYRGTGAGFDAGIRLEDDCEATAVARDLDGDGDADVVCGGFHTVAVFQNQGGNLTGGAVAGDNTIAVDAADVDGDGDVDLLAVRDDPAAPCAMCPGGYQPVHAVAWYENLGGGAYAAAQDLAVVPNDYATFLRVADLDGDAVPDLLIGSGDAGARWARNLGGGTFAASAIFVGAGTWPGDLRASDLDGDGDLDVAVSWLGVDTIGWFENLGGGVFGPELVISASAEEPTGLALADIDGDGRPDLLAMLAGIDAFDWFANPAPPDTDGDGLTDDEEAALGTDPLAADSDGGGTCDGDEVAAGTDPLDPLDDMPGQADTGDTGGETPDTGRDTAADTGNAEPRDDTGAPDDTSAPYDIESPTPDTGDPEPTGCQCATSPTPRGAILLPLAFGAAWLRRGGRACRRHGPGKWQRPAPGPSGPAPPPTPDRPERRAPLRFKA